jgi:hypothetical protein
MQKLPIRFPSEVEVIRRDVARYAHLTPSQRWEVMLAFLEEGAKLAENSPNRVRARRLRQKERQERRQLLAEFIKKHGVTSSE